MIFSSSERDPVVQSVNANRRIDGEDAYTDDGELSRAQRKTGGSQTLQLLEKPERVKDLSNLAQLLSLLGMSLTRFDGASKSERDGSTF